ncbi:MFS transporter [Actinacidiphila soli]|uniref:MFS transporter n=1 Tax=Actinacidiphila soli TaxID=2487275 RepID=UPI000FCA9549|nr:MFS transporter [Actinacidiphila soli]
MPFSPSPTHTGPPAARHKSPVLRPANAGRAPIGIAIVLVAQLMLTLDTTIVNVALPKISTDLGFSPSSLSWVLNAYTLAFGGLLLLGGRLGDTFGRLRVFEIGLAVFTASSLLGGLAQSPAMLIAARAAQGIGAALAAPGVLALVTTSARDEAGKNRALALFSAVGVGGGTLGLVLGGLVTEYGSWRWTMFVNVPIGIGVLALARRFVTETPRNRGRFDFVGAIAATGAAVAVVWSLIGAPEKGWTSPQTIGGLAVGAVLLAVLAVTERRVTHPLLRPDLLRSRRRLGGLAILTLVFGSQISTFFLVVQYVQQVLNFSPLKAGLAFLPMTVGIFALSRVTPRLVGRFGQAPLLMLGTLGLTGSFAWLSNIDTSSSYFPAVFGPLLLNGIAAGLTFMPAASLVVGGVKPEHAGSASGLLQTTQQLGGAIGLAVVVSVYAAGAEPGAFVPGAHAAFLTTAAFTLTAFIVTVLALRPSRHRAAQSA